MSASYVPAHEHSNGMLKSVKGPTVDYCGVETLRTFVRGPGPLTNLYDFGEAVRGIL